MEPVSLWIVLLCVWSLLHFWLLPVASDRWAAADLRTKLLKAGSLAVLEKLRDLAAIGALVLALTMLVVGAAARLATSLNASKALVDGAASMYTAVKDFSDGYGTLLTVLGIVAAAYSLWRCARHAKRRVTAVWSAKAQELYKHLRENPAEINAARADPGLKAIFERLDTVLADLARLDGALAREPADDALPKSRKIKLEQLSAVLSALAIEMTSKDVTFDTLAASADGEDSAPRPGNLLLRILTGQQFCKDVGLLKTPLSRVVTALLFVTLIGWGAEPLANSLQLTVNNLRVNLLAQQAQRDLDVALSRAKPDADDSVAPTLPNPAAVQAASRLLARVALREMLQSSLVDRATSTDRTPFSQSEFVRAAINEQTFEAAPATQSDLTDKVRKEVAQSAHDALAPIKDFKHAEKQLESMLLPSVQELASANPGRLQRIVAQMEARYGTPMAALDAQGELIGDALDEAFDALGTHPGGELGKQADKLMKEFGKKALVEWAQAYAQRFMTLAILDTARPDVWIRVNDDLHFETSHDMHDFLVALNGAEGRGLHNVAADDEARMDRKVAALVAQAENDPGAQQALAARMSGYDSLFPSHDDDAGLPGIGNPDAPAPPPGGGGGGFGGGGESPPAAHGEGAGGRSAEHFGAPRGFANARARSFGLASLSFRVRGVLIGQDAQSVGIDISDLKWTLQPAGAGHPTLVTLYARMGGDWRNLGTFDAAVVNQALRYAADGRVIATTITQGDGRAFQRLTYLHPALVDTPLGCRVIDADRIIDTFSDARNTQGAPPAFAQLVTDRENTYIWMNNVQIAEAVARMPQEQACPQQDLEQLAQDGKLKQSRFSPELGASLDRFIDDRERAWPGSTQFLRAATACSSGESGQFADCVCKTIKPAGLPARYWFPEDHTSQLRERNSVEKPDLQWLQLSNDGLGNFDLWVHITFSLRNSATEEPDEVSATALDFPADELIQLRQVVAANLPRYLQVRENSPSYSDFMGPLEQFVVVQRFARAALSGKLGRDFPASRLVELTRATRQYVPFQRTIRWEPVPSVDVMAVLQQADPHAADIYRSWKDSQDEREMRHEPLCDAASR